MTKFKITNLIAQIILGIVCLGIGNWCLFGWWYLGFGISFS
jgi:hypothetical protein